MNSLKVGVLLGGSSSERDVSICSGKAIAKSLRNIGYQVVEIGENEEIEKGVLEHNIDIAFIALHGRYGEDGTIQKFLEDTGIPYTGSDSLASRNAFYKETAKSIFLEKNIQTPLYFMAKAANHELILSKIKSDLSFPVVVKPVSEGSSIGLSIVRGAQDLKEALLLASKYSEDILIEAYIPGKEITVGILGGEPLSVVHIVPKERFYNYKAKYTSGMTEYIVPAKLETKIYQKIQDIGLRAHKALGCRDFSRVDLRLDPLGQPWVLEVNTIPGFTKTSLLPKAALAVNISFEDLCERILKLSWVREQSKTSVCERT